ncbi:MAG: hypothetical protein IPL08_19830 [Saprospiraceae bacterium]|nr:hypothetical protein [Saprospiraceae bacterium]
MYFEIKVDTPVYPGFSMGSIGGGGRYDNLTGVLDLTVSQASVSLSRAKAYMM